MQTREALLEINRKNKNASNATTEQVRVAVKPRTYFFEVKVKNV
jgi:hypothetical protein